jgi:exonuclease VII large subunit
MGAELGEEISRQIEAGLQAIDLEAIGRQVSEEMDAALSRLQVKLESVDWERIGTQSQSAVERAMEQMRRNMDRMVEKAARHQEKVERKVEREQRRLERLERRRQKVAGREQGAQEELGDAATEAAYRDDGPVEPEPDLDEERLSILRMVEQGQISPEEAEMLLDALQ